MSHDTTRRQTLALLGAALGSTALTGSAAADTAGSTATSPVLQRFAQEPLGAEVTGLRVTPGGAMFLNVQHPSEDNPAPYDTHAVGAVYNFDGGSAAVESLPVQTGSDARRLSLAGAYEHQVLAHGGDDLGDGRKFGVPVDADGANMDDVMEPEADMNVFVPTADDETEGYLFTNFEAQPGMVGRMRISRADTTSEWSVHETENLDFRPLGGTWNNCNGWISPWGTPLSSEEYPDEAAAWYDPDQDAYGEDAMARYLGEFGNPYRYGYVVEVPEPTTAETPTPVKRYALGRLSHEVALPMPDERTVYLSDDWDGGVLCKFVADERADLSSGTLYAATLDQDDTDDPARAGFDVEWIRLAHGEESEIESWIAEYDGQDASADADYLTADDVRDWANGEAEDDRVAFLEPRKAAAAKGATNEWQKLEGLATKPDPRPGDELYVACSSIRGTMADYDGDVQLENNAQGAVYSATITGNYDVERLEPALVGYPHSNAHAGDGAASPDNTLWGPDNLEVLADGRGLFGEDGDRTDDAHGETLNFLWLFAPGRTGVSRHRGRHRHGRGERGHWYGRGRHGRGDGEHGYGRDT
ncbi:MAG: alkaline phosphatase PhoX [Haloarculaceae archaeon]